MADPDMPRTLHLATTNAHKAEEIRAILTSYGIEIHVPADLPDVVEDGATFRDNALLKARSAARHLGAPALADDSGLAVEVLGGDPGVHSARFAGEGTGGTGANNALLVERLTALGVVDPEAAFVCHAVVVGQDGAVLAEAEGRVEGVIRWPGVGSGGFGYDPLFHHPPSGCRLSELTSEQKNAISHRGLALRRLAAQFGSGA